MKWLVLILAVWAVAGVVFAVAWAVIFWAFAGIDDDVFEECGS